MSEPIVYPYSECDRTPHQLKTPVYLLGLGMALIKQYFGSEDRVALEKASLRWREDSADCQSEIYIGTQDNLDQETIQKRPAVIVAMGDVAFPQAVIADRMSYDAEQGIVDYLDRAEGTWTFYCISEKPTEALGMATEIKYFFQTYRHFIANTYSLDKIRATGITSYKKHPEVKDYYGCVCEVMFALQDNFGVSIESLKISGFDFNFDLQ